MRAALPPAFHSQQDDRTAMKRQMLSRRARKIDRVLILIALDPAFILSDCFDQPLLALGEAGRVPLRCLLLGAGTLALEQALAHCGGGTAA